MSERTVPTLPTQVGILRARVIELGGSITIYDFSFLILHPLALYIPEYVFVCLYSICVSVCSSRVVVVALLFVSGKAFAVPSPWHELSRSE